MTFEEALEVITAVLAPETLTRLQIAVVRATWNRQSYLDMSRELNHEYGYIKDIGAELWQRLSQKLDTKVTKLNLQNVLMQAVQMRSVQLASSQRVDWGEAVDVAEFCGREEQLVVLHQWVMRDCCRLVAIVGIGGIGKTMLVTRFAQQVADTAWFEVVVWRSLRQALPLEDLLRDLIQAIAPQPLPTFQVDVTLRQLLEELRNRRCLLILDNVEAVLEANESIGTYRSGYEPYGQLFQLLGETQHQSSILLTSREVPAEIADLAGSATPVRLLRLAGLSVEAGATILTAKGLAIQNQQSEVQQLVEQYHGNPLALKMVATLIQESFGGNLAAFLAQESLLFRGIRYLLTQQFERLSALEQQVMYWLAINREAVTPAQLQADLLPSISLVQLRDALLSLDQRSLVEKSRFFSSQPTLIHSDPVSYTQQPVVMEYITERLIEQICNEVEQSQIDYFRSHALLKAQVKDYVRETQLQLIVKPLLAKLIDQQQGAENLKMLLLQLLNLQQQQAPLQPGYFGGNAINLLCQLGANLSRQDFSNLMIWQADLRRVKLHGTRFRQADLSGSAFTHSIAGVLCVVFSPDATRIASSHDNGEIYVWQVEDGQQIAAFRGFNTWIKSIVFGCDNETLISSGEDGIVRLLHISSGVVADELQGHTGAVWTVALSRDGRWIASGGEDESIRIWSRETGDCLKILKGHEGLLFSVAFGSSDPASQSDLLASGHGDNRVWLWNLRSGTVLRVFEGHTDGLLAVAFSPDSQILASASVDDTIRLWDVRTGEALAVLEGHQQPAWSLAFSPDGRTLVSGSEDQTIKFWDIATRQCRHTLLGHMGAVQSVAFNSDGTALVSADNQPTIRLWNARTGQCLRTWQGYSNSVFCVVFSPDGQTLASSHGDNLVRVWDVQTGQCLNCLEGHIGRISAVVFSPNACLLASGSDDQSIRLWDAETGHFLRALPTHSWVNTISFNADGSLLASSGIDRMVRLWEVQTGRCLRVIELEANWIPCVRFSPVKQQIAIGNADGTVKLWNAWDNQCLLMLEGHTREVQSISFDPEGHRLVSGGDDQTIRLWDLQTGQCLQTLEGHENVVTSVCFHPNSNLVVSASQDQLLKLWNLEQGTCIQTLSGHTSAVSSVAFDPEGRLLVSSSEDGTIRLWDSYTGECLRILAPDRPYEGMDISGVTGLSDAQKETLRVLGAIEC